MMIQRPAQGIVVSAQTKLRLWPWARFKGELPAAKLAAIASLVSSLPEADDFSD